MGKGLKAPPTTALLVRRYLTAAEWNDGRVPGPLGPGDYKNNAGRVIRGPGAVSV